MATRSIRGRRIVYDSSSDSDSDDEFPDLKDILKGKAFKLAPPKDVGMSINATEKPVAKSAVRRSQLGAIPDNPLLQPLGSISSSTPIKNEAPAQKNSTTPQRLDLRTRKTQPVITSFQVDDVSEAGSVHEETIIENFSGSDFDASLSSDEEADSDSNFGEPAKRSPSKPKGPSEEGKGRKVFKEGKRSPSPSAQLLAEATEAEQCEDTRGSKSIISRQISENSARSRSTEESDELPANRLAGPLSKFQRYVSPQRREIGQEVLILVTRHELKAPRAQSPGNYLQNPRRRTPPAAELQSIGLASPSKKISRIPATPHPAQTDTFWNQEFIDEWNDEHSPKKQLFPPSAVTKSPSKTSSSPKKGQESQAAVLKASKKAFAQSKHELADKFLLELDERITNNEISQLSAATGGIRIDWTNKLHTTAGRANWKRETIKKKTTKGETTSSKYRHHASIELSTKVIDDENRLLNVIAHEFCHLANFMISGITTNPHGKEFKGWAAKVTAAFGDRDIDVTTKHSYDIDFKYVWECTMCMLEFKRHSKSINPERHRCGACKSELKQTKPVPRTTKGKESEYQRFMKEQMRLIKEENPGSPQKDIMRIVASRWSQRQKNTPTEHREGEPTALPSQPGGGNKVEGVTRTLGELTIADLT